MTRVDNNGRVIEETVTGVNPIAYTYDMQGRLIETLQGDRKSAFTYDALSRLASATDPLLRTTTFAYDSVGRITQQVLPGEREISYAYDRNGNLTSLTPPGKPTHSFGYTAVDLTARYKPPLLNGDSTVTRYLYDLERRIRNTIRPDSIAVSVFYDTLGCGSCGSASRPKTIIFDRGTLNFAYDSATGLLNSLSAPGGNVLTYNYDGTLPRRATWSGEVSGNVEVAYDNNFRATSQKVNDGNDVNFQYDQDGLLTAAGGLAITRDPQNGRITGTMLGSITTGQSYNSFGELKSFHALFNADTLFKTVDRLMTYGNASCSYTRNGEFLTKHVNIYYSVMTTINQPMSQQLSLLRRALLGALVGAFLGALELWFFEFDLPHFWAAVGAGATFMSILATVVGQLQHRGFKLFLVGGLSGSIAGIVWWLIANQTVEWLSVALGIGMILGVVYVWMEEIAPFKCEKCGTKFALYDGGFCSECKRFFCSSHLDEIKVGKSRKPICIDCKKV